MRFKERISLDRYSEVDVSVRLPKGVLIMHPTIAAQVSEIRSEPNTELLSRLGWQIGGRHGRYCVVWKDAEEVTVEWTGTTWRRVSGR